MTFKSLLSFSLTFACLQIVFMSFLKFSQQTPIISLRQINRILLVIDMQCGLCQLELNYYNLKTYASNFNHSVFQFT
jgi:hypothetical protein